MKGRGFRCGSDEKMMRMWFGQEIDVDGLPPLVPVRIFFSIKFGYKKMEAVESARFYISMDSDRRYGKFDLISCS